MIGRLAVVGVGPGDPDHLTRAAAAELAAAQVVVGYGPYLERLPAEMAPGRRESFAIGEERVRARRAVRLAAQGRRVALVSSGDAGVYGMAPLAIEELARCANSTPDLVVIPGVTAALAAGALLGAPLAVDFACLSLSDVLLSRSQVVARIEALAAVDIVLALYNPASRTRRETWDAAVAALQRHRAGGIPAVAVRRAFRDGQSVELCSIADLHRVAVDMETIVLVGCSRTRRHGGLLYALREDGDR